VIKKNHPVFNIIYAYYTFIWESCRMTILLLLLHTYTAAHYRSDECICVRFVDGHARDGTLYAYVLLLSDQISSNGRYDGSRMNIYGCTIIYIYSEHIYGRG